jgi:hypothetical protein
MRRVLLLAFLLQLVPFLENGTPTGVGDLGDFTAAAGSKAVTKTRTGKSKPGGSTSPIVRKNEQT